jgi:DNA polymerase-1
VELAEQIIQYRELMHDYGTYVVKLSKYVTPDSRLHPNLRQNGTVTGRFTSNSPNSLGIPKRMRRQFTAPPGHQLVSVDLSQIELAMCAWYAQDDNLLLALHDTGVDVHQYTADQVGVDRNTAKRINYSMVYGIGVEALANRLNVPPQTALVYMNAFNKAYPGLRKVKTRVEIAAKRKEAIRLWNGRVRRVPEAHKAWSFLIQSGVAELSKDILMRLHDLLKDKKSNLVLHVHDDFWIELADDEAEDLQPEIMEVVLAGGADDFIYSADLGKVGD